MSKNNKAPALIAGKSSQLLAPVVDKVMSFVAAAFILATSYKFVQGWLATHQISENGSVAAGIMVVAIALYLIIRKR